jgi:nonribosomal peptide synthetase DhbF
VKIRGFRVEPDEVRVALEAHPSVGSAFIQAREFNGDRRLVAYVTLKDRIETDLLRSYLQAKLPEYMVPSTFITIDALPITPNGKIDHRALPDPAHATATAPGKGPAGDVELALAAMWKDILGLEDIGAEDDFFDLGGHSIAAVRLIARIENKFNVRLPLNTIFLTPTIRGLARAVREAGRG